MFIVSIYNYNKDNNVLSIYQECYSWNICSYSCFSESTHQVQNVDDGDISSEDWDSDEYWVPHSIKPRASAQEQWLHFVKRKMQEGNFCPVDLHVVSIGEKVKYEKLTNPTRLIPVDGQFDDYSSDESWLGFTLIL